MSTTGVTFVAACVCPCMRAHECVCMLVTYCELKEASVRPLHWSGRHLMQLHLTSPWDVEDNEHYRGRASHSVPPVMKRNVRIFQ